MSHQMIDTRQAQFSEAASSCGYEVEPYKFHGYHDAAPSVQVDDSQGFLNLLADLAEEGFDIREVSFDGSGRGYRVYVR